MTDYPRSTALVNISENSDFSSPYISAVMTKALTSGAYSVAELVATAVVSPGTTVDLGGFTTISELYIQNNGLVNVTAATYHQLGTRAAGNLAITQGSPDKLEDQNNADFASFGAGPGVWVRTNTTPEDAGNRNQTWLIQSVQNKDATRDEITLAQDTTVTTNADDDAAVLSFEEKNGVVIPTGQWVKLVNVLPVGDLLLVAASTTASCKIVIVGT